MNGVESGSCGGAEGAALAEELARAVELAMSPTASQDIRRQAYNACERFVPTLLPSYIIQNCIILKHLQLISF